VSGTELANHLRLLSGYHMGTDLVDRLATAERSQKQQREALAQAADEIERLTAELAKAKAETHASARLCG
jgi:ABC-type transporter Mla subunit MlaD